jgi:hypothetical protein
MTGSQGERDCPSKFAHYIGKELVQTMNSALNPFGAPKPEQNCLARAHELLAFF